MKKVKITDDNCFKLHPWRVTPDGHFYRSLACVSCGKVNIRYLESKYIFYRGSKPWNKDKAWVERVCDKCFKFKKPRHGDARETWRLT